MASEGGSSVCVWEGDSSLFGRLDSHTTQVARRQGVPEKVLETVTRAHSRLPVPVL